MNKFLGKVRRSFSVRIRDKELDTALDIHKKHGRSIHKLVIRLLKEYFGL